MQVALDAFFWRFHKSEYSWRFGRSTRPAAPKERRYHHFYTPPYLMQIWEEPGMKPERDYDHEGHIGVWCPRRGSGNTIPSMWYGYRFIEDRPRD